MCVCMRLPPSPLHSFSLSLPLCVCSGEAVVAGWRRTWWPRQEMLQKREGEVVVVGGLFLLSALLLCLLPSSHSVFSLFLMHTPFLLTSVLFSSPLDLDCLPPFYDQRSPSVAPVPPPYLSPSCFPSSALWCSFYFFQAIALLSVIKVLRLALKEICLLPPF